MSKKNQKILERKRKRKNEENNKPNEKEDDFINFEVASKKLIAALNIVIAKIKNDTEKDPLLFQQRMVQENNSKNTINNEINSTFPSLSIGKSINEHISDMNDENCFKSEISDINNNSIDDSASFGNLISYPIKII